jgi:UTP--glucose-1-phosphate uridylyltransferase
MKEEPRYLVIPAAGLGTRMKSVNALIPKEMLPVGHKPAIQYAFAEGLSAGITHIIVIINKDKELIKKYCESEKVRKKFFPYASEEMDEIVNKCTISFVYQEKPRGEFDAIGLTQEIIDSHFMAVIYPDNIYFPAPGALKKLKTVFVENQQDVIALIEVTDKNKRGISNSGRIDHTFLKEDTFKIGGIYNKGKGHFEPRFPGEMRICGIQITGPHIFKYIEKARQLIKKGEIHEGLVRALYIKKETLLGFRVPGTLFDIGNPEGYKHCLTYLSESGEYTV